MIRDWSIVLWPLGICLLACLVLIGERLWPRRGDAAPQNLGRERDLHVRTVAAAVMGIAIAAVAFLVQYFSARPLRSLPLSAYLWQRERACNLRVRSDGVDAFP